MQTVFVTGGAGFIGSNLSDALLAEGLSVHVIDNLSTGQRVRVPSAATFHKMDIRDLDGIRALADEHQPAVIFHLAAQADVRKAVENPGYDADVNITGTLNVLEAARRSNARVIFASTGGAGYGEYDGLAIPTPETAETRPMSHYGMSKMAGEGYCRLYHRLYGADTVILRLGNVYGPRQDPHGEAGVVAIFCGRMLDGEAPTVFGDGLQTRDYVYVGDVVEAFLAARTAPPGETFNIGTGTETSVIDLIDGLGAGEPQFAEARLGELQRSALAADKARSTMGWTATMPLTDGLDATRRSVQRHRDNPEDRAPGYLEVDTTT